MSEVITDSEWLSVKNGLLMWCVSMRDWCLSWWFELLMAVACIVAILGLYYGELDD